MELKGTICSIGRRGDLSWKLAYSKYPRASYMERSGAEDFLLEKIRFLEETRESKSNNRR